MTRSKFALLGASVLLSTASFMFATVDSAQAQGLQIGPNGMSLGGYYIPFNDGRYDNNRYDNGRYNSGRYDNRGRYVGPRDPYGPGYGSRDYYGRGGRASVYWSPGMYWSPNDYWYGDRNWARYDNGTFREWDDAADRLLPRRFGIGRDVASDQLPLPQLEELQRMDWLHLRRVLTYGSAQLEQGLDRLGTGAKWATFLRIDQVQAIAAQQANEPPTGEEADQLLVALEKFNQTADDAQFSAVSGQWGFETVQRALAEFLENPAVRYRRQLVMNSADLDRALDKFGTGAGWQQHLSLPADLFVDPEDAAAVRNPPNTEKLRLALLKYDEVAKNPAYRVINGLPEFQDTHASLARYLGRELPVQNEPQVSDGAPEPPADPSLNEPAPVRVSPQADPFSAEPANDGAAGETPVKKPAPNSVLKPQTPSSSVEELLPPPSDEVPGRVPAVREKE